MTEPAQRRDSVFVVGLDRSAVLKRRKIVRNVQRVGAWVTLVLMAVGMGLSVTLTIAFPGTGIWPFGLLMIVSMVPLVVIALKGLRVLSERERWYAASGLPPFAMRMSPAVLELGCEGAAAPVVLPWAAVRGFTRVRRLGQPVLELVLAAGVTATTPGVRGLDQPAASATMRPSRWVKSVGLYGVAALDQHVEAIDQAMRHFSGGRSGIIR